MADFSSLFRSTEEQATPVEAEISGEIPAWVQGTLVRLGPGKFDLEAMVLNHWFDGYAVLIRFHIEEGKVTFLKKFLQSEAYKKAISVGKPVYIEYGTRAYPDPTKSFFSRIKTALLPELTDSDAINIFRIEDSVFVASETNFIHRIDPFTLDTKERIDLSKMVPINWASSHYFKDDTGASWTMGTSISTAGLQYKVIKVPAAQDGTAQNALQNASVIACMSPSWKTNACYYHSFAMSSNYIVFVEQPLVMNGMKILAIKMKARSLRECMDWQPEDLNRFMVVDKSSGKCLPVNIKSKTPFFSLHHINAYEHNGHLVVDTIAHDSPQIVDKLYLEKLRRSEFSSTDPSYAVRHVIPLHQNYEVLPRNENLVNLSSTSATAVLVDGTLWLEGQRLTEGTGYELPTISPQLVGLPYRYFYCTGMYDPGPFRNSLVKVDTTNETVQVWKQDEFTYPGEVHFIPKPDATREDEGVLLASMTDVGTDKKDCLLILDATTMTEIARARVNEHVPNLIHNIFIPRAHESIIKR